MATEVSLPTWAYPVEAHDFFWSSLRFGYQIILALKHTFYDFPLLSYPGYLNPDTYDRQTREGTQGEKIILENYFSVISPKKNWTYSTC